MRYKTKLELAKLAEIIVNNYKLEDIIGCNEFLEVALEEAEDIDLEINYQTIKKNEEWLKLRCKSLEADKDYQSFTEEGLDDFIKEFLEEPQTPVETPPQPLRTLLRTINYYSDNTYEIIKPEVVEVQSNYIPEYTMFIESEDGFIVTRGAYKDKYVHEIDLGSWVGCAAGWANKILNDNERLGSDRNGALTEDDKVVLNKIKQNKLNV
jgi:hypothetical protein